MYKKLKVCLIVLLAFTVMVQYSFTPQILTAYGQEGEKAQASQEVGKSSGESATTEKATEKTTEKATEPTTEKATEKATEPETTKATEPETTKATEPETTKEAATEAEPPSESSDDGDAEEASPSTEADSSSDAEESNTDAEASSDDVDESDVEASEDDVDETEEEADDEEDEEEEFPAQSFSASAGGVHVSIHAPKGALPKDSKVKVRAISASQIENAVERIVDNGEVVKAVDITFYNKGKEIEPKKNVSVTFTSSAFKGLNKAKVVHIKDSGAAERVSGSSVSSGKASFKSDDFSIYAVVEEGEDARLEVIFMNGDSKVASTIVKKSDIDATTTTGGSLFDQLVYDPGAGSLGSGEVFRGWTTDPDYTVADKDSGLNISKVRTAVKAKLNEGVTESGGEPAKMYFYAMTFKAINITYKDEDGVVIKNVAELTKTEDTVTHVVDEPYVPKTSDQEFQGWYFTTQGTITDEDGDAIAEGSVIKNGTTVKITSDLVLSVNAPKGFWLIFKENAKGASYTSPQFLENEKPEIPTDPTLFGHTFGGWYEDADCTDGKEFNFDQVLEKTTIVYAKWIENETAGYNIIIWKQNAGDAKNAADSAKTYDFAESISGEGNVGTLINDVTATGTGNDRYASVNGTAKKYTGFHLNKYDTNVTIDVNGTSVVNVYYDRNLVTLKFLYRNNNEWATQTTMTGLYGQTLSQNDYTWPTNLWWYSSYNYTPGWGGGSYSGSGTRTTFMDAFITSDGSSEQTFYGFAGSGTRQIRFYKKNAAGNYVLTNTVTTTTATGQQTPTFYISDKYNGYKPVQYRYNQGGGPGGGWTDWIDIGDEQDEHGYYGSITTSGAIDIRFDPKLYNILYEDGVYVDGEGVAVEGYSSRGELKVVEDIAIDADLSSYNEGKTNYYEPEYNGFTFAGWYIDDQCKQPYTFTTMTEGITVYAKWIQNEYRVFLHPNAEYDPTFGMGEQSTSFRISYGESISSITAIRADYELVGWYTDASLSTAFNFDAFVANDTTVPTPRTGSPTERNQWGDISSQENKDANRFWVKKELNLYAKWRSKLPGANGITVIYEAGDGTFDNDETTYKDPLLYKDVAKAVATTATTPNDTDKYEFDYWEILKYDKDEGAFVETGETVLPADTFVVKKAYSQVTENEGSTEENPSYTYTFKLKAHYKEIAEETLTHITWHANNGTSAKKEVEDIKMNAPVAIEPADLFSCEGYEFVGWARWPSDSSPSGPNDMTNLWLTYENGQFTNGGSVVTKIAADEKTPYHDLYACWAPKLQIKITGSTDTKTYNGSQQSVNGYEVQYKVGNGSWTTTAPQGVSVTLKTAGSDVAKGTDAGGGTNEDGSYPMGLSAASFNIPAPEGYLFDASKDLTVTDGWLKITKASLTITANDQDYDYNGSAQGFDNETFTDASKVTVEGLKGSDALTSIKLNGQETDAGEYAGKIMPSAAEIGTATDNYDISYVGGKLTIKKAKLTITANDQDYDYNGSAQGFDNETFTDASKVTVEGLKGSDALTSIKLNGQETNADVYPGKIVPSAAEIGEATGNYDITYVAGNLTIKKASLKITAKDQTYTYNDEQQGFDDETFTNANNVTVEGLKGSDKLTSIKLDGHQKEAGEYDDEIVPSAAKIGNATNNYDIEYVNGKLTIKKAKLTITAKDQTYVYNGKVQGEGGTIYDNPDDIEKKVTVEGLQGDDTLENITLDGQGMDVNEYPIVPSSAVINGGNKNYDIEYVNGTLTITAKPVVTVPVTVEISTTPKTVTYNGKVQSYNEYTVTYKIDGKTVKELPEELEAVITPAEPVASGKDAGSYSAKVTVKVQLAQLTKANALGAGDDEDVEYDLTNATASASIKLKINRAPLTVTTPSASKEYDGSALTSKKATLKGLVAGETATAIATGSQTEVGSSENGYEITWGTAKAKNYKITEDLGTLTVTDAGDEPTPTPTPTPTPDNGGGGGGPAAGTPVAAVVNPVPTPVEIDDTPTPATIEDEPTPLADNAVWALINLLCTIATALLSLIMLVRYFGKRREEDEETGEKTRIKKKGGARVASLIPAIGAIIAFILTEDMSNPMVMVDKWTLMMVVILAIQVGVAVVAKKKKDDDDEDYATEG